MKLLNKAFKPFAIFTVCIVLFSIPAYYYVIQKIYLTDADESLLIKKHKIQERISELNKAEKDVLEIVQLINALEIGLFIQKSGEKLIYAKDSIYTIVRFDPYHNHEEPFRVLESLIRIQDEPYFIKIEADLDEFNDVIPYTATVAGIFFLFILAGYYLVNKWVSEKTWSPFMKTIETLEGFSISSDSQMPEIKSEIQEFQKLSKILKTYTKNNQAIFKQQKAFIENASHELQTPLTILQAKADTLMQTADLNANQFELIDELKQIIGRMTKINKNLLLLAKIENKQFDTREQFNLKDLLAREIAYFSELAKNKLISFELELENEQILEGNLPLTEILINNLLRNAINYNLPNGEIKIILSGRSLDISNTSKVQELDRNKIFQRFSKATSTTTNTGLGLSICQEICTLHQWELTYTFADGRHTFSVRF